MKKTSTCTPKKNERFVIHSLSVNWNEIIFMRRLQHHPNYTKRRHVPKTKITWSVKVIFFLFFILQMERKKSRWCQYWRHSHSYIYNREVYITHFEPLTKSLTSEESPFFDSVSSSFFWYVCILSTYYIPKKGYQSSHKTIQFRCK